MVRTLSFRFIFSNIKTFCHFVTRNCAAHVTRAPHLVVVQTAQCGSTFQHFDLVWPKVLMAAEVRQARGLSKMRPCPVATARGPHRGGYWTCLHQQSLRYLRALLSVGFAGRRCDVSALDIGASLRLGLGTSRESSSATLCAFCPFEVLPSAATATDVSAPSPFKVVMRPMTLPCSLHRDTVGSGQVPGDHQRLLRPS